MLFQQYSQRGSSDSWQRPPAWASYVLEYLFVGRKLLFFISSLSVAGQYGELPGWPRSLLDRVWILEITFLGDMWKHCEHLIRNPKTKQLVTVRKRGGPLSALSWAPRAVHLTHSRHSVKTSKQMNLPDMLKYSWPSVSVGFTPTVGWIPECRARGYRGNSGGLEHLWDLVSAGVVGQAPHGHWGMIVFLS